MKLLKPRVYLFLTLLIGVTALLLVLTLKRPATPEPDLLGIILWTIVAVLSESLSVYYVNGTFFVSPIEAVFYAAYLSCGPLTAAVSISLTFLLIVTRDENRYRHIFNTPLRYILFNIFHFMLIMLILDGFLTLSQALLPSLRILPVLAAAPLFFTLSCLINAALYKVEDGESFTAAFKEMFDPYYQTAFPASLAAVIIGFAYLRYGLLSILIMITPLLVTLITIKAQVRDSR